MQNEDALTPEVDLPGQQPDVDLEPSIEPEPDRGSTPSEQDEAQSGAADDPGVGNTLISPENS